MTVKSRSYPSKLTNWGNHIGGGTETIEGFGHDLRDLGVRDCGGPMILKRTIRTDSLGITSVSHQDAYIAWTSSTPWVWDSTVWPSDASVKSWGTTAIANTLPTNAAFDTSNAVGELMIDGIPSVIGVETWRNRAKLARSSGSEYLNYEFGWLPLVNDIRNFSRVVVNHKKIMDHFYNGSGKQIRVKFDFPGSITTSNIATPDMGLRYSSSRQNNSGKKQGTRSTTHRRTFSGCYTYYAIPPSVANGSFDKFHRYSQYAGHLLGVELTPETVWNLAPWSWAVDWFSNTGDIIHNISAFAQDSLVMKYGYITSNYRQFINASISGTTPFMGETVSPGSMTQMNQRINRFPASPYFGFGTSGSLSGGQKAILLALGLSKTGF